jgi:spoIIIJ-associated protein
LYDPKNESHEFVAAEREQAIAKAVQFFGVGPEALTIRSFAVGEVYGLGGRAVVVAEPRDRVVSRDRGGERERPDRGERGGRGERSGRGERGGRGGRAERARPERARPERELAPRPAARASQPSVGTARGVLSAPGQFVLGLIERLELGPFEIAETEESELRILEIRGEAGQKLAEGDGRPVDALQLVANQAAMTAEEDAKRVVVDVEGSTDAREAFLGRLVEQAVRRARDGGRAIALDPMSGRDRRIVHMTAREHESVATMSIGEGRYRQVVIVPEGAPEYQEALEQAQAAQRGD